MWVETLTLPDVDNSKPKKVYESVYNYDYRAMKTVSHIAKMGLLTCLKTLAAIFSMKKLQI